jgi:tRNA-dihydrouridine synthase B
LLIDSHVVTKARGTQDSAEESALDRLSPHPILLAPMVGITHFVVRKAIQEYLPPGARALWLTEMLSSRRIPYQSAGQFIETRFDDRDQGLCPQLLGNEEGFIRDSIAKLRDWGAVAIDINMGCPARRALSHNYGVALMGDPSYAAEITAMAVKHASGLPVSVKLRAAPPPKEKPSVHPAAYQEPDPRFLESFCRGLQDAGASWITLHPRTAAQKRKGDADWSQIASIKRALKIPVIGNGDVQTVDGVRQMLDETGCDRVMVGRALLARPWMLRGQEPSPLEEGAMYGRFLSRVLELMREHYAESLAVRRFKHLAYFGSPYLEFGHHFYASLRNADTYDALDAKIGAFFGRDFEKPQRTMRTTQQRY